MESRFNLQLLLVVESSLLFTVYSASVKSVADPLFQSLHSQSTRGSFLQASHIPEKDGLIQSISDTESRFASPVHAGLGENAVSPPLAKHGIRLAATHVTLEVSGPENLAQYCAGVPTSSEKNMVMKIGTSVDADWMDMGTFYPGTITKKNANGTVNIHYEDGFDEKHVDPSNVKIKANEADAGQDGQMQGELNSARDDPACELQDSVRELKANFEDMHAKLQMWLVGQRARVAKGKRAASPPTMASMNKEAAAIVGASPGPATYELESTHAAAAPAPAVPGGVKPAAGKTEQLEQLKSELSALDERIKELEAEVLENDEALQRAHQENAADAAPAVTSIDALIEQYRNRVAQRHLKVKELEQKVKEQELELAHLGAASLSLEDIWKDVENLVKESDRVAVKRYELEKQGKLDDELAAIVDSIVSAIVKLQHRVRRLADLEAKAKAREKYAEHELATAKRLAAERARQEGKSPEEVEKAVADAARLTELGLAQETKHVELEALQAGQDVDSDLKDVQKHTTELDTGLHPHGEKWWRYRYEHSYIEALIMIFIVILYLIWNFLVAQLQALTIKWSLPPGTTRKTVAEKTFKEKHGGKMYSQWLECLAKEMLVCILVFLSVWLISKTPLFYVLPQLIMPAKDMRVPSNGEDYLRLAVEICTIFFFAILFYFYLMLSMCHATILMTEDLEKFHQRRGTSEKITAGGLARSQEEWDAFEKHCQAELELDLANAQGAAFDDIKNALPSGYDFSQFPLYLYLKLNIRVQVRSLLAMDWILWLPVVVCFAVFMILHRYAHAGYVRIMFFFSLITLAQILWMYWHTVHCRTAIHSGGRPVSQTTIHNRFNTELFFMCALRFSLFFVCYGVARMICQTWMWELHFWPVLWLTLVALLSGILFVFVVAPIIPTFCALMAIPPYVGAHNAQMIAVCAQGKNESEIPMDSARSARR